MIRPTAIVVVRKDSYHDSILLLRLAEGLKRLPGVEDAVAVMATPANLDLLRGLGYAGPTLDGAGSNDLILGALGAGLSPAALQAAADRLLRGETTATGTGQEALPATLAAAVRAHPEAQLAMISVPGAYAAREAGRALALGLHVMLFSDNVAVEDEISLKREAARRGLLLMGPDCGTAILSGLPLGFANVVRRGTIGMVGASGTGIQEVACCLHRLGAGISQAIGTGGRDLSDAVGGIMTLLGIAALAADPGTQVIVVVSKPPSRAVAARVVTELERAAKPAVVHFVGSDPTDFSPHPSITFAGSLAEAAEEACRLIGLPVPEDSEALARGAAVAEMARRLRSGTRLRGLFCGGTTGHEALVLLTRAGLRIHSNLQKDATLRSDGSCPVEGHLLLDLGDDVFTRGRPHPMIEPVLRNERLALEAKDLDSGLLLFDLILGYGAHPDPAGILAEGVTRAFERASRSGRTLAAIASCTGTSEDPQGFEEQVGKLKAAGILVLPDNRSAARAAAAVLGRAG